jgi:DNA-binding CsgD family transcriptional regulator
VPDLTPRQLAVGQLMAEGLRLPAIADRLGISIHTARAHVAQAGRRLNGPGSPQHRLLLHVLTRSDD